jgi:hypothetical protein
MLTSEKPSNGARLMRATWRLAIVALAGLTLAACDKCGNSIFHASNSGPVVCRGPDLPK